MQNICDLLVNCFVKKFRNLNTGTLPISCLSHTSYRLCSSNNPLRIMDFVLTSAVPQPVYRTVTRKSNDNTDYTVLVLPTLSAVTVARGIVIKCWKSPSGVASCYHVCNMITMNILLYRLMTDITCKLVCWTLAYCYTMLINRHKLDHWEIFVGLMN